MSIFKPDGLYFAYLRKSREDHDAERNGAEDTLSRHEYILKEFASKNSIQISRWYKEVVSGETIENRPEMKQLLHDVEILHPDGVLVIEVERLSRGTPQDQGIVMDTFKYSNSLIITPMKIYDLNKENDEEWIDFGLLRSRMEYRTIKRRLQNGRTTSAMQGKYIGNIPPYGWQRQKLKGEKGYTLVPDPETGWVLKLMYTLMYTGNDSTGFLPIGTTKIARILDNMGIAPPKGERWDSGSIGRILTNPANIGMVRIGWRKQIAYIENGKKQKSRPINSDCITVPARWSGQVDKKTFDIVSERIRSRTTIHSAPQVKSPLAGIVYCSECHRLMQRRPKGNRNPADTLLCKTPGCPTVASYYDLIEKRLIETLETTLQNYKLSIGNENFFSWESSLDTKQRLLKEAEKQLAGLKKQSSKIHAAFEQDIYDMETFLDRSREVKKEITEAESKVKKIEQEILEIQNCIENKETFIPRLEHILTSYQHSDDPIYKNALLKEIVSSVDYTKKVRYGGKAKKSNDLFELDVHLKLKPI